jgi:hypothetical protein
MEANIGRFVWKAFESVSRFYSNTACISLETGTSLSFS